MSSQTKGVLITGENMSGQPADAAGLRLLVVGRVVRNRTCRRPERGRTRRQGRRGGAPDEPADRVGRRHRRVRIRTRRRGPGGHPRCRRRRGQRHSAASMPSCSPAPSCRSRTSRTPTSPRGSTRSASTRWAPTTYCAPRFRTCPKTAWCWSRPVTTSAVLAPGVAAYGASKAALDEILHSWRSEHPELSIMRVGIGPTQDTEILRGADRDLLAQLFKSWVDTRATPRADVRPA